MRNKSTYASRKCSIASINRSYCKQFLYFPRFISSLFTATIRLIFFLKLLEVPLLPNIFSSFLHKSVHDKRAFAWRFSCNKDRELHGQTPGGGVEPRRNS
ncbi:hypothetical protein ILYODFUR_031899 [Ilyodon furcidens]|uniref:Uncharacterized protein n=1 Tax=Ilyodon furcidens TaxID=33524 RepID=A0ABV0UZQ1_9TELE